MSIDDIVFVLEHQPWLVYGMSVLFGLALGSFLNVVILRLPRMLEAGWKHDCAEFIDAQDQGPDERDRHLTLSTPPSTCPACGHRIRFYENIPILSYLMLRGRCSACKTPIGARYPLIEAFTALLTLVVVMHFGLEWQTLPALALTWTLIALAFIDLDTQLLPDTLTLPMVWLGLILSLFGLFTDSQSAIIGAVAGYLSLWSVYHLFRLATGKEGMGYGDFKLLALFGAWLGWQYLPQIVLLSALTGAVLGGILIASGRHQSGKPMPFGPFLASAGWISLIWGEAINETYLQIAGLR